MAWPTGKPHTEEHRRMLSEAYRKKRPVRMAECHPDRKHSAKGLCHSCYVKKWAKDNPDANTGNNWSRNHPEQYQKLKRTAGWKKRGINITFSEYAAMWEQQGGLCANRACGKYFDKVVADHRFESLQVDHDHETGEPRGLLCGPCNRALGLLQDNGDLVKGLLEYMNNQKREK